MRPVPFKLHVSDAIGKITCEIIESSALKSVLVLAHGAGAGMYHQFMVSLARELAANNITTLRFQFSYMENNRKRPDRPEVAVEVIRSVVAEARRRYPNAPIYAGGKSFGGRMTSLYAAQPAPNSPRLNGLVFYGFPLHPAGKPSTTRADHLTSIPYPMLFLQGTRDKLADPDLLNTVLQPLRAATLNSLPGADHSFHMLKSSGISDGEMLHKLASLTASWMNQHALVEK